MAIWTQAKVWKGSNHQGCGGCKDKVLRGQWSRVNVDTGKVWHDDCSEDAGSYND